MAITREILIEKAAGYLGEDLLGTEFSYGMLCLHVQSERIAGLVHFMAEEPVLEMKFLTDITAMHLPDNTGKELVVIYHLHSLVFNYRLRIKCFLPIGNPVIPSLTSVFSGANWMERETYDFFGVEFSGHPDLRRILNVDEMDYFPLRKEYPLEDQTRTDKKDQYFGR